MSPAILFVGAVVILILFVVQGVISYIFPPRCETCGRRYNHHDHDTCPYCVPLDKPSAPQYAPVMLFFGLIAFVGMLIKDAIVVGLSIGLCLLIVVSTQKRIPWGEYSRRVLALAIVCLIAGLLVANLLRFGP